MKWTRSSSSRPLRRRTTSAAHPEAAPSRETVLQNGRADGIHLPGVLGDQRERDKRRMGPNEATHHAGRRDGQGGSISGEIQELKFQSACLESITERLTMRTLKRYSRFGRTIAYWSAPSPTCVCGRTKENPQKRYCKSCGDEHGRRLSRAHRKIKSPVELANSTGQPSAPLATAR